MWRNVLSRVGADLQSFDLKRLGEMAMSGREVNHCLKLGLALSSHRNVSFDMNVLLDAIDASNECRRDLSVADFE